MNAKITILSPLRYILYIVLFGSGASALIYQIVWIRKFGLVFGVHVFSMATVLTAFMAGLALGALYLGRLADRHRNPVKLFLFLELGIGLFALLFPFSFQVIEKMYSLIAAWFSPGQYMLQLIRFFLAFLFLLIPATLMGGTMPVIIRIFGDSPGALGGRISRLYAINNLGAVAGGLFAGFLLIRLTGLYSSGYIAAAINIFNVLLVWIVVRSGIQPVTCKDETIEEEKIPKKYPARVIRLVLWVFAIEGFTTLAYEILWSRILVDFSIDKTVYFSTVIIISFIFGLGLGSLLVNRIIDRHKDLLSFLGINQILIGLLSVVLLLVFTWVAPGISLKRSMFGTWLHEAGREYLLFFCILTVPVTLMGITYPLVSKLANDNIEKLGGRMGFLGFLDTIGSVLGSFIAGFVLVPFIGVVKSFAMIVLINIVLGSLIILFHPHLKKRFRTTVVITSLIIAALSFIIMPKSPNTRSWWEKPGQGQWFNANRYTGIRFFDEGAAGTVTVRDYPDGLALNINGHNTAYATKKDLKVNRQLGYLPYLLHENPKTALVIGFGMGATVCSLNQEDMERIDVAEICHGVLRAAYIFNQWNRDVIHQPKVRIFEDDGRSVVYMSKVKYDIITSNSIHPRLSNNIYTRDFYELCYKKLNDNGILCQWIPENWMTEREYKSLVKSFTDVFPHSTMWYLNEYSTLLVGTKAQLRVDGEKIIRRFESNPILKKDYAEFDIFSPYEFLGQFWMSEDELTEFTSGSEANTDDHPLVEFSRVINIAPVSSVMQYLVDHKTNHEVILNDPEVFEDFEWNKINEYSNMERHRMQSIINVTNAYTKHIIGLGLN